MNSVLKMMNFVTALRRARRSKHTTTANFTLIGRSFQPIYFKMHLFWVKKWQQSGHIMWNTRTCSNHHHSCTMWFVFSSSFFQPEQLHVFMYWKWWICMKTRNCVLMTSNCVLKTRFRLLSFSRSSSCIKHDGCCINNDEFCITNDEFVLKMMNCVLKMTNFVLKMMRFVFTSFSRSSSLRHSSASEGR